MNRIYLSASLALTAALTSCEKQVYPQHVPIGFLLPVTMTPSSRTMQRGDTLWLEANFSDSLLDKNSGRRYRVRPQDLQLNSAIFYRELLGVGSEPNGIAPTFRLVEKIGTASIDGAHTGSLNLLYDGQHYQARIGLIPTKAGVTSLTMRIRPTRKVTQEGGFLPFISLPRTAEGQEQKAVLDESFYVINQGKANNFDLYSQYRRAFSLEPGTPANTIIYETQSTFTVEVK